MQYENIYVCPYVSLWGCLLHLFQTWALLNTAHDWTTKSLAETLQQLGLLCSTLQLDAWPNRYIGYIGLLISSSFHINGCDINNTINDTRRVYKHYLQRLGYNMHNQWIKYIRKELDIGGGTLCKYIYIYPHNIKRT